MIEKKGVMYNTPVDMSMLIKKLPGWSRVVPKSYFGLQGDA